MNEITGNDVKDGWEDRRKEQWLKNQNKKAPLFWLRRGSVGQIGSHRYQEQSESSSQPPLISMTRQTEEREREIMLRGYISSSDPDESWWREREKIGQDKHGERQENKSCDADSIIGSNISLPFCYALHSASRLSCERSSPSLPLLCCDSYCSFLNPISPIGRQVIRSAFISRHPIQSDHSWSWRWFILHSVIHPGIHSFCPIISSSCFILEWCNDDRLIPVSSLRSHSGFLSWKSSRRSPWNSGLSSARFEIIALFDGSGWQNGLSGRGNRLGDCRC